MEIALLLTGVQNPVVLDIHPENQDHNMVCSEAIPTKHGTNTVKFQGLVSFPCFISGLHLTLDINQDDYIGYMAHSAGVSVVIHPQGIMPFPDEEGISISPGELTDISLTQV